MRKVLLSVAVAAILAACSPPQEKAERPEQAPPAVAACNALTPNPARQIAIGDEIVAAAAASDLRGASITPGVYDLASATRIGSPTGWNGTRAVALQVSEDTTGGVNFNWAGAAPQGETDTWTAAFMEAPTPTITFICGRMGTVDVDFAAEADALQLRLPDGANGSLQLNFERRR